MINVVKERVCTIDDNGNYTVYYRTRTILAAGCTSDIYTRLDGTVVADPGQIVPCPPTVLCIASGASGGGSSSATTDALLTEIRDLLLSPTYVATEAVSIAAGNTAFYTVSIPGVVAGANYDFDFVSPTEWVVTGEVISDGEVKLSINNTGGVDYVDEPLTVSVKKV